jgi:hypothetical protein
LRRCHKATFSKAFCGVAIVSSNGSASALPKPFQLKGVTMKSSPLNPADPTSASSLRDNPCFSGGPDIAALQVLADGSVSYLLPYAQFLSAERRPNPALEREPEAPPEQLLIRFARADVVVLGSGLARLETVLQKYELKFVKATDRRLAATLNTHIAAVAVTFIKEKYDR